MQGWRVDMEDAHTVQLGVEDRKDYSFFAVFDGHGGSLVSQTSAQRVLDKILATPEWKADSGTPEGIGRAMVRGFLDMDEDLRRHPDVVRGDDHSGSTAIAAMVTPSHIIVANCGDSRSILVRGGAAVEMSFDHKPYNEGEHARILQAGGTVTMRRVNGDLAVSRALGDFVYKQRPDLKPEQQQVSAEPEIKVEHRSPEDQLLVLACDGIWDVMSNAEVAEFLHARPMASTDDLKKAAEALLEECLTRGSRDNMSVVLAGFAGARLRGAVGASAHPVPAPAHDAAAAAASAPAAAGGAAIGGAGSAAGPSAGAAPAAAGHTEGV